MVACMLKHLHLPFSVLGHWDFIRSVFRSGHAAIMVEALGSADADSMSNYSVDALR